MLAVAACSGPSLVGFDTVEIEVGDETLTVARADTSDERRQGLRDVDRLPQGLDGMLFVYEEAQSATYVMRDTTIPLDIWWFDPSAELIGTSEMAPCVEEPCVTYGSPGPVMWVLETPSGIYEFAPAAVLSTVGNP